MSEAIKPQKPYKGLIPYAEEDAQYFFGRERERKVIMANLMASRLTLLYGASGVGKSSVLRAGVAQSLENLAQENLKELGTPEYLGIGFSSWRDNPTNGLLKRVEEAIIRMCPAETAPTVDSTSSSLADSLHAWAKYAGATLLITLDQFEEYFLYRPQHSEERAFDVEFTRAVNSSSLDANFLISIREDALAKLDAFREEIPNLFENYLRVEHLDYESARAAIEGPLRQYNILNQIEDQPYTIEPELVNQVLSQVKTGQVLLGGTGQGVVVSELAEARVETPYLQIVMTRLWDHEVEAQSHTLRLKTLEDLGGAQRIIETHLDAAMNALSEDEQKIAAKVFNYLVTPSGTKIAHTGSDLAAYSRRLPEEVTPMLEKLASWDVRILRTVPPPADQPLANHRYEIFHDVLASAILDWKTRFEQKEKNAEAERLTRKNLQKALDELNDSERDVAFRLFNSLITTSGTRATLTIDDMAIAEKLQVDHVRKVVTRLSASDKDILRAMDVSSGTSSGTYYEISNELLVAPITEWRSSYLLQRRIQSPEAPSLEEVTYAGRTGVIFISSYYLVLALLAAYAIFSVWPRQMAAPVPGEVAAGQIGPVRLFFWTFFLSNGARLVIIALLSGLLGALAQSTRSFLSYVSERMLVWATLLNYMVRPFMGAAIGFAVILIMQAGFLDKKTSTEIANPVGIAGIAAMAGFIAPLWFSETLGKLFKSQS